MPDPSSTNAAPAAAAALPPADAAEESEPVLMTPRTRVNPMLITADELPMPPDWMRRPPSDDADEPATLFDLAEGDQDAD